MESFHMIRKIRISNFNKKRLIKISCTEKVLNILRFFFILIKGIKRVCVNIFFIMETIEIFKKVNIFCIIYE